MATRINRRAALGIGTAATAGLVLGNTTPASAASSTSAVPEPAVTGTPAQQVKTVYQHAAAWAGGQWRTYISIAGTAGGVTPVIEKNPDDVVQAYSVNKIAVAAAVLDKVDRGLITLDQRIDVTSTLVIPGGDGIFSLDGAYPSSVTLGHGLAALLTVSDDTAVRICGLVCPTLEINQILTDKGYPNTQVQPGSSPNRFFLGTTTPRETHNLLQALVNGTLLSAASTNFLLTALRSPIAFTDGIRRNMSSDERLRVATKAGWYADGRNEVGIIFNPAGAAVLTYAMFADGQAEPDNYGATHPVRQASAVMGRFFYDAVKDLTTATMVQRQAPAYRPTNGG
ncbi:serine hydrolase [Micromonospora sp. NPDC003197]